MWEYEHAVVEIEAWKVHLQRAFQQDLARQDALSSLDEETVIVINDWAMQFLPMRFRERQSQWFGKRGISWHFSAVIHLANHPDRQCTTTSTNGFKIHTYIAVLDSLVCSVMHSRGSTVSSEGKSPHRNTGKSQE